MPRYWSKRGKVYEPAERRALIDAYHRARQSGDRDEARAVAAEYEAATPIVALSRCPFTGEVFETSLDLFGIDGLWWIYDRDIRPHVDTIGTLFAFTGALVIDGPVADVPTLAMVGPGRPFVVPRILDHPALRAVVSSVLIGEHVGFPIVYFAQPIPADLERVDDWGHSIHYFTDGAGNPTSAHATEYDPDKDFDLAPWIERGKLSWIDAGDLDLTLRSDVQACPYLGLDGPTGRQYIEGGQVRLATDRAFPAE